MKKTNFKRFYIWIISSLIVMALIFAGVNVGAFKAFAVSSSSSIFSGIVGSPILKILY